MEVVVKRQNETRIVPMHNMPDNSVGVVLDGEAYARTVVLAKHGADTDVRIFVAAIGSSSFWTGIKDSGAGVLVELLPKGTVLEITL